MATTAVITQPTYMPWLGYFEQVARADVFVFLDSVQFVRRNWDSRNRLKGKDGRCMWLTVPVMAHRRSAPMSAIRISPDQPQWRKKHLRSIQVHLGAAPYFEPNFPYIGDWINGDHEHLADLNIAGIKLFARLLGLAPRFMRSSELNAQGDRTALLVNICKQVGADRYYSSFGAKVYMEKEEHLFAEAGIDLAYQTWEHPTYRQLGDDFVSHLSVVDALMNIGAAATRAHIVATQS